MRLDCSHTYETTDKKIKLVAESFEEPTPSNLSSINKKRVD